MKPITYKMPDGTQMPINLVQWAKLTQTEEDYNEVVAAQEAQYKLPEGEFDPIWDKWWILFTTHPNVMVPLT
jgi:hypothetical protein